MASTNGSHIPAQAADRATLNVSVSGRHMQVGDALRSRIIDELNAGIGKYFERGGSAEVTLTPDGHGICCDVVVLLGSGQQLVVRGQASDAHAAFDSALTKLETRIRRYKRRLVNHHHANGSVKGDPEMASVVVLRAPEDDDDSDVVEEWGSDGSAGNGAPEAMIIAEAQAPLKTQTVSMAVMELDLTGSPVVLFRNVAHGGLSVVYRRGDGNIGWIDPERTPVASTAGEASPAHARM
jgi:ribosomal subunit interface protein